MAGYSWQTNSTNDRLYAFDDDDIDDEEFLKRGNSSSSNYNNERDKNLEEKRQELLMKKKEIEQRTIKSTENSLSYLRSSEEVGVATAEELLRQREQLERTEKRLDDINSTLRFSQRHIQGIKSVFGGLKNYISGKTLPARDIKKPTENSPTSSNQGPLSQTLKSSNFETLHPGLRIHDRYMQDVDTSNTNSSTQDVIDENLSHMLSSITKLKGLAHGLSGELDSQNEMLDNVLEKAEKADSTLVKQNKDITKLMK